MNASDLEFILDNVTSLIPRERTKIRIVYAHNPPDAFDNCMLFPTYSPTLSCPFPGWTMEILTMIVGYLNYEIVPVVTSSPVGSVDWGTLKNGTWTGMLGYLFNDTADVVCLLYQYTDTRGAYYSFSYNVYNVKPVYAVKKIGKQLSSSLWNAFDVYSIWIWVGMITTFLCQTLYSIFVARVEWKMQLRATWEPIDIVWRFARLQLTQPEDFWFFSTGGNIALVFFSIFQAKLMMTLYQILLLEAILQPADTNPFKNMDDMINLVAAGEYKLITNYIGNWYFDDLANRYKIGNIPKCPDDTTPTVEKLSLMTTFGIFLVAIIGFSFSIIFFIAEIYFAWQHNMIKLRLKTRRAIAEPIHLMAVARMFGDPRTQKIIDDTLAHPTSDEKKEHIGVAETGFS
ncbi:hypothetical protein FO519_007932 [Halicephalobus sp. NKZ332]|nr:hypothetical protein FO519_007932 [Halicephalobus sp. NKZ332]